MRKVISGFGELLITVGVLLLLFATYQLWWTNVLADRAAAANRDAIIQSWQQEPNASPLPPEIGSAIGLMTIPRLGGDVVSEPVLQGVDLVTLAQGMGHYPETAMPGQPGNFAIAGHRATNGEPLRSVDLLQDGDLVYLQTATTWYVYRLFRDEIVSPADVRVVTNNPWTDGSLPPPRMLTITTCHPRWSSAQRWIWWGEQIGEFPVGEVMPEFRVSM